MYGYTNSATIDPVGPHFLRITDIQNDQVRWDTVPYCEIATEKVSQYRLESGDIVFSRTGATTGKSFLVSDPPEAVFASYLIRLRITRNVAIPRYVNYYFQSFDYWKAIKDGSVGSAQGGFNASKLGEVCLPVPSLKEQERIVAILDEAFEAIATAKANAETCLQNAQYSFEVYRDEALDSSKWKTVRRLGEIASFRNGINFTQGSKGKVVKIIGVRDFQNRFSVPKEDLELVTIDGEINQEDTLRDGDLLTVRSNGNPALIGRTMVSLNPAPDTLHSGFTIRTRLAVHYVSPQFLCHFMKCGSTRRQMIDGGTGISIKSLNQGTLANLDLPIPPLPKQASIVTKLEEIGVELDNLQEIYRSKLSVLEELKQSLLHQAFTGKL